MEASASNILQLIILAGLLSIVYGFITGKNILNASSTVPIELLTYISTRGYD